MGAVGDGTTDDTAAIQATLDRAFGTSASPHGFTNRHLNRPVFFPAGIYKITASLNLTKVVGGRIRGAGVWATKISLEAPAGSWPVVAVAQYQWGIPAAHVADEPEPFRAGRHLDRLQFMLHQPGLGRQQQRCRLRRPASQSFSGNEHRRRQSCRHHCKQWLSGSRQPVRELCRCRIDQRRAERKRDRLRRARLRRPEQQEHIRRRQCRGRVDALPCGRRLDECQRTIAGNV